MFRIFATLKRNQIKWRVVLPLLLFFAAVMAAGEVLDAHMRGLLGEALG